MNRAFLVLITWPLLLWSCSSGSAPETQADAAPYRILHELPHDPHAFTQGLVVDGPDILESSGLYGKSFLSRYDALSAEQRNRTALPDDIFAEGIAILEDQLYLLTWKSGRLLVFDKHTLRFKKQMHYQGEGWGITYDGRHFVTSDGSDQLSFRDVSSFEVKKRITVSDQKRKWSQLNELEFIDGKIWANVWQWSIILVVDPGSGEVLHQLDLSDLVKRNQPNGRVNVLNGIAYDPQRNAVWVTGKNWPKRYLLEVQSVLGKANIAE